MRWQEIKARFVRWWVDPAPSPEQIGNVPNPQKYRPIPIELGFHMHADKTVYQRMRDGSGDRRIHDLKIINLVHEEYFRIRNLAKKERDAKAKWESLQHALRIKNLLKRIRANESIDVSTKEDA